jgi:hypothetical protein
MWPPTILGTGLTVVELKFERAFDLEVVSKSKMVIADLAAGTDSAILSFVLGMGNYPGD